MQQSYIQQEELYFGIYGYIFYYLECEMCQCMICNCWWYNYCGVCCGGVHSAELVCSYWLCKPPDLMAIDPECCHICACDGLGGNCLYYGSICCAPQSVRQWSAIRSGGGGMGGNTIIINNNQPIYSQPQQGYPNDNINIGVNPGYPGGANVGVNMGYGNNPVEMRSYNNGMGVNMNAGGVNMNTGVNMNAGYNANMNQGYAANNYNQGMNTNANNGVSVNTNLNGNANMNMGVNPNQNMNLNMNGGGMNMNTGVGMNINSPGMNAKVSF